MKRKSNFYKISQLEQITETPRRTIHFYVEIGLLHAPVRTGKTMAYYDDAHLRELLFINESKKKGIPLIAIHRMLESRESRATGFGSRKKGMDQRKPGTTHQPKKKAGKVTRKRIIEEGALIFQEKGFKETKVNDIIDRLNIGKGSFYSYFSNKKELFLECVPLIFERFFSKGWNRIREEKNPYKRLIVRAEITVPVMEKFFIIMKLCQEALKEDDPKIHKLGEQIYLSIYTPLEEDIVTGIRQGIFRPVDPKLYSLLLISAMEGINSIMTMNPDISIQKATEALLDILTKGLVTSCS
jgi:AcrR family transcriptional regulator